MKMIYLDNNNLTEKYIEQKISMFQHRLLETNKKNYTIAVITIGENKKRDYELQILTSICNQINIRCDNYWYKQLSPQEYYEELQDLCDFNDGVVLTAPTPTIKTEPCMSLVPAPNVDIAGINPASYFYNHNLVASGIIDFLDTYHQTVYNQTVLIIGNYIPNIAQEFFNLGATVILCNEFAPILWHNIEHADLIIINAATNFKLNCYTLKSPIIDISKTPAGVNVENRIYRYDPHGATFRAIALINNLLLKGL